MSAFTDLMQKMVNKDYDELVGLAKLAMQKFMPVLAKIDTEYEGVGILSGILVAAIGADGKLTALERSFVRDVTGLSDDNIDSLIKMDLSSATELTETVISKLADECGNDVLVFIMCLFAVDETINRDENAFLHKFLG